MLFQNGKRREKEAWNAGADYIKRGWEIAWNKLTDALYFLNDVLYFVSRGDERLYAYDINGRILELKKIALSKLSEAARNGLCLSGLVLILLANPHSTSRRFVRADE